jgi:hypothetical protein
MCRLEIRKARCRVYKQLAAMHDDGRGAGGQSGKNCRLRAPLLSDRLYCFLIECFWGLNLSTLVLMVEILVQVKNVDENEQDKINVHD